MAFTWEMGLVVSLGSITQLAVSLIQSKAMVLALQYQGYSSRGLLCKERKSVIILRPPICGEVTGFAFLSSSYCADMTSGIVNSKARLALNHSRHPDEWVAQNMSSVLAVMRFSILLEKKQRTCVNVGQVETFSKRPSPQTETQKPINIY